MPDAGIQVQRLKLADTECADDVVLLGDSSAQLQGHRQCHGRLPSCGKLVWVVSCCTPVASVLLL